MLAGGRPATDVSPGKPWTPLYCPLTKHVITALCLVFVGAWLIYFAYEIVILVVPLVMHQSYEVMEELRASLLLLVHACAAGYSLTPLSVHPHQLLSVFNI